MNGGVGGVGVSSVGVGGDGVVGVVGDGVDDIAVDSVGGVIDGVVVSAVGGVVIDGVGIVIDDIGDVDHTGAVIDGVVGSVAIVVDDVGTVVISITLTIIVSEKSIMTITIIIEIKIGCATTYDGLAQRWTYFFRDVLKVTSTHISKEQRSLGIVNSWLHNAYIIGYMAIQCEDVWPAIQIVVEEE